MPADQAVPSMPKGVEKHTVEKGMPPTPAANTLHMPRAYRYVV
jgi:hypothetical protein